MQLTGSAQAADAPEELVEEGHLCYHCQVPLLIADPAIAERRLRGRAGQLRGRLEAD